MTNATIKNVLAAMTLAAGLAAAPLHAGAQVLKHQAQGSRAVAGHTIDRATGRPLFRGLSLPKGALPKNGKIELGKTLADMAKQKAKRMQMKAEADGGTVVDEDFAAFAAGTEDEPDATMICGDDWSIPDSYFKQPGWTGMGVSQGGGTCALAYPDYGGVICTPMGDYSGTIKITFRAKALASNAEDKVRIDVGLLYDPYASYIIGHKGCEVEKGKWNEYELTVASKYGGTDAFVQINSYYNVVIDDVKVTKQQNYIAEPTLLAPTNFTYDGFTANWKEVGGADEYLLSVFKQVPTEDVEKIESNEDFSSTSQGNLPAGWTFSNAKESEPQLFSDKERGIDKAILLENGDTIATPDNGGKLISIALDFIAAKNPANIEDSEGKIEIEGWDGFRWVKIGTLYTQYGMGWGSDTFQRGDLSEYTAGKYYKCRFSVSGMPDDMAIAIDNAAWTTLPPTENVYEFKDKGVKETSYTLTGLDPEADYYYTVRARNSQTGVISEGPTQGMDAFGVAAPKVKDATDIDSQGAYTANWESAPKATAYSIENYDVYTAPAAEKEFVILHDSFDKIDGEPVTPQDPFAYNNATMQNLDDLTDRMGWYGYLCGYAQGAIGSIGLPAYGIGGQLQSPELSLGHNGGKFHLKIMACSQTPGEYLYVYTLKSKKGVSIRLDTEYKTYEADFEGGQDDDILVFESTLNTPFFISDITVTQDIDKGDKVYTLIGEAREEGSSATSHRFEGLKQEPNHTFAYGVYSIYQRYFDTAWSVRSPKVEVDLGTTGISNAAETTGEKHETARYTLDGRRASKDYKGMVIVRYSDGTATKLNAK